MASTQTDVATNVSASAKIPDQKEEKKDESGDKPEPPAQPIEGCDHYAIHGLLSLRNQPFEAANKKLANPLLPSDSNAYDVFLGRNRAYYRSSGNVHLSELVKARLEDYRKFRREGLQMMKSQILHSIVKEVTSKGGRFLKQQNKVWTEVTDSEAKHKVSHLFRDSLKPPKSQRKVTPLSLKEQMQAAVAKQAAMGTKPMLPPVKVSRHSFGAPKLPISSKNPTSEVSSAANAAKALVAATEKISDVAMSEAPAGDPKIRHVPTWDGTHAPPAIDAGVNGSASVPVVPKAEAAAASVQAAAMDAAAVQAATAEITGGRREDV